MKKILVFVATLALTGSIAACGCQNSNMMDNTTNGGGTTTTPTTSAPTTKPMIDPTIIDPTFETNIPDSTVNDNSTDHFDSTSPSGATDDTIPRSRHFK